MNDKEINANKTKSIEENKEADKSKTTKEEMRVLWTKRYNKFLSTVLIIAIILLCIQKMLCISRVSGNSMAPTYKNEQVIFVKDRNVSHIKREDVILFKTNPDKPFSEVYIKRVVGVPGDTVYINNGKLYINNIEVNNSLPNMEKAGIAETPIYLNTGEYFVLGDNRNRSNDSRNIGVIKSKAIIGIVAPNAPIED